jgi:hypothetical protein
VTRRPSYTKVLKKNQLRARHVAGQSDRLFRLISCLELECTATFVVPEDRALGTSVIACPECGYEHQRGRATKSADYELLNVASGEVLAAGPFEITHDAFLDAAPRFKYCIICSTLQPAENFDRHTGRRSGLQGECRVCKQTYNEIKNGSRLPEQHREAADNRRMMIELAQESDTSLDLSTFFSKFAGACFKCQRQLVNSPGGPDGYYVDHTLPAKYLWPLWIGPTMLCRTCNGAKADKWPSEFYETPSLRRLAVLTDIDFDLLTGIPHYNPLAIKYLQENSDAVIERWIAYSARLQQLRQRVLDSTGIDVFATAAHVPTSLATRS